MKRLDIDFAAPSVRQALHRSGPRTWALLALGFALSIGAGYVGGRMHFQNQAAAAQLLAQQAKASVPVVVNVPLQQAVISEPQAGAVNAAVLQLNLPWRALHDAVGAATPPSIALLALEPDARKRAMRITAEAKSSDDMIAYIEVLKQQALFASVVLARHEINEQDANRPIRFQVDAEWSAP